MAVTSNVKSSIHGIAVFILWRHLYGAPAAMTLA
jgi:hypothetical protein